MCHTLTSYTPNQNKIEWYYVSHFIYNILSYVDLTLRDISQLLTCHTLTSYTPHRNEVVLCITCYTQHPLTCSGSNTDMGY